MAAKWQGSDCHGNKATGTGFLHEERRRAMILAGYYRFEKPSSLKSESRINCTINACRVGGRVYYTDKDIADALKRASK